jgi:hypothetical protein
MCIKSSEAQCGHASPNDAQILPFPGLFLLPCQSTFQTRFEPTLSCLRLTSTISKTPITDMPLKLDTPSLSEDASLSKGGDCPETIQDSSNKEPRRIIAPLLQAILVLIAFGVHYLRVHHIPVFGVSLNGLPVPPECVVFCTMIGVVAIQQVGWEARLLKDAWKGKG